MVEMSMKIIKEGTNFDIVTYTLTEPEGGGKVVSVRKVEKVGPHLYAGYEEKWFCNANKINEELLSDIIFIKGLDEAYKNKLRPVYDDERVIGLLDENNKVVCRFLAELYHPPGSMWERPQVISIR
jgi:hypothetical protein